MAALHKAYTELDASLIEINPLIVTEAGDVLALDAKMTFDDNPLFRHPEIEELRDLDWMKKSRRKSRRPQIL